MKKIAAALLALAMLCSFFCIAEESLSTADQAKNVISVINYFVKENSGVEQLFVGFQEAVEGQVYGFFTDDNTLQALVVANEDENTLDSCSFICDDPAVMPLALNCASLLPFAQLLYTGDESTADALREDMIDMAAWFDEHHLDAMEAFENGSIYGISYLESEFFHLELVIVPLDEGSRLMASYYFSPAETEE